MQKTVQDEGILWGSISIITELIGEILRLTQDQIGLLRSKLGFKSKRNRLKNKHEDESEEEEYEEGESYVLDAMAASYFG